MTELETFVRRAVAALEAAGSDTPYMKSLSARSGTRALVGIGYALLAIAVGHDGETPE